MADPIILSKGNRANSILYMYLENPQFPQCRIPSIFFSCTIEWSYNTRYLRVITATHKNNGF
jgi:hypothetical protein